MDLATNIAESKFSAIVMNAPVAILEMDANGSLVFLNNRARALLTPLYHSFTDQTNICHLLASLAPEILDDIRAFTDDNGLIINQIHKFSVTREDQVAARQFKVTVHKLQPDSFLLAFEDVTMILDKELAYREASMEKAVAQGKFEIAADALHDIGNAVVGLSSHTTRIRRILEGDEIKNLHNLAGFFAARQPELGQAIGEAKAAAVVSMLKDLGVSSKASQEEIQKSVTEQFSIITHIQDLLNIQRQYLSGGDFTEKKPVHLRSIINDCLSMLYATLEKRKIKVSTEIDLECPALQGHHTRLMQVVMNVLKNSMEAIAPDAAERNINIRLYEEGSLLVLKVRDTGHGFDPETGNSLFRRGFTTKSSGTGLGLHNCQTILESHAATFSLASEGRGKGALATITFKL